MEGCGLASKLSMLCSVEYEYTCNVLLLGCLGLSTLEQTKELIGHSRVKSHKPMI